jgi:HAD superfamily hydrolase (TIGR01509 family)
VNRNKNKTIVFDFFGVICSEVAPFWFKKYFSDQKALELKEKYFRPVDIGEMSEKELLDELGKLVGKSPKEVKKEWFSFVKINQDVISIIESLKQDFKIVLCSNALATFLRQILKENDLEHLFDEIIISSEIRLVKPDPSFFERSLEIIGEKPENLIFIDDNPLNVSSAQNLGIESHLFKSIDDIEFLKI